MKTVEIEKEIQEEYDFHCWISYCGIEEDFYKKQIEVKRQMREFVRQEREENLDWVRERRMEYLDPIIKDLFQETWKLGCFLKEKKKEGGLSNELAEQVFGKELKEMNSKYKRLTTEYGILKGGLVPNSNGKITEDDVAQAKEISVENYLTFNRAGFSRCVWHDEKSPSLKFYRNSNKVHCFGCGKSADVIDIVMNLYSMDFLQAVKFLIK